MDIALGVIGAGQAKSAGEIANIESKVEAKQIETAAAQREADRKERLARAVSSQMARGGASGAGFEGSPLAVIEESQRREKEGTQRDELMAKTSILTTRARGKVAKAQGRAQVITGLLQTASDSAKTFTGGGSSGTKGGAKWYEY